MMRCQSLKGEESLDAEWSDRLWATIADTVRRKSSVPDPLLLLRSSAESIVMTLSEVRVWLTNYRLPRLSLGVYLDDKGAEERGAAAALIPGSGTTVLRADFPTPEAGP